MAAKVQAAGVGLEGSEACVARVSPSSGLDARDARACCSIRVNSRPSPRPDAWARAARGGTRLRQRAFFTFGMDVLLKLDLAETREFFAAFFALSDFHWQGFLSARLTFPEARRARGAHV